jgi:metal-sulfur cluster biosynthetic enzyme
MNAHPPNELVRIGSPDKVEPPAVPVSREPIQGSLDELMIWNELKTIYDPEIPVNIVDLGLIYSLRIVPLVQDAKRIEVAMTLTAPGCAMAGVIKTTAENKLSQLPQVREVRIDIVFDPPWHMGLMSEEAKLQLGL